jgi:alpha-beta hydrolase superfamily lysophospholipase
MAEHSERYDWVARWLVVRGYSVHAFDQRGHGSSEGPRNHAPSFETLLDDLLVFLSLVQREEPGLPLILLGHSLGGLEVAGLLALHQPNVAAAVLSGPALLLESPVGPIGLALGALVSRFLPRIRVSTGIDPNGLSRDPGVVEAYVNDPRIDTRITMRLAAEVLSASQWVRGSAHRIQVPVLIVHGDADPLCRVEGSRQFQAGLETPGCELRTYPGLLHEVLNEPEREEILRDMHAWIGKRVEEGPLL